MNAIIKATGISTSKKIKSSLDHATIASKKCLEEATIDKNKIDVIINIGVYRDENLSEPAIATFIQNRLDINLSPFNSKTTFSFDLRSGACGLIYAFQTAISLINNKKAKNILISSSDSYPSERKNKFFPYTTAGAALLVSSSNKGVHFSDFFFRTSENDFLGLESFSYTKDNSKKHLGKNINFKINDSYEKIIQEYAAREVKSFLEEKKIDLEKTLFISSQLSEKFHYAIAESVGLKKNNVVNLYKRFGDLHTSSLTFGYHIAKKEKRLKGKKHILFLGVSPGISIALALYKLSLDDSL